MSDAKIYLVDSSKKRLMPMNATRYVTEDELQAYLADYADLIPGDQINPEAPRRWLLVATGIFRPSGEHTLQGVPIDEQNQQQVLAVLELIFQRVDKAIAKAAVS